MTRQTLAFAFVLVPLALTGCQVGPDYERPKIDAPDAFRSDGSDIANADPNDPRSLGDLQWFEVFRDPNLRKLVLEALEANYDIQVAADRVVAFRAQVTRTRSAQFPTVNAGADYDVRRFSDNQPFQVTNQTVDVTSVGADFRWEFDFWGKFSRATESARAQLLAVEANRRAVVQGVVVQVANSYFTLMELDKRLKIARDTLATREYSLKLVNAREFRGVASMVDVRQAESLVYDAALVIPETQRQIEREENLLSILLGRNPGAIARSAFGAEGQLTDAVPAGLPSDLLERRPDVTLAEQLLVSANARIGVAKAALYPSISLTAFGGVRSDELSNLFSADSLTWAINPAISMPIFNAGALAADVEITEANQRAALASYLQTVKQAFEDVSNSLVDLRKLREVRHEREQLVNTTKDLRRLSTRRYEGGVTSYLEVLESERQYFDSELTLLRSQANEQLALIALYRALGGGWQMESKTAEAADQKKVDWVMNPEKDASSARAREGAPSIDDK